ncbi:MAG: serine/threonine protein kinase [Lentisphaeraceae bacterium]|nr:serine/threonine protein kinase [Lentisphaeraceae bacterium]
MAQQDMPPPDPLLLQLEPFLEMIENCVEFSDEESSPLLQQLKENTPRYSETSIIARGGMKTIAKTFDNKTGRFVAMAKLHANTPRELYEPFLREARLTALLDHPNIISIFDIDLDEESAPYFTMELKTGQGLNELIKDFYQKEKALKAPEFNRLLDIFLKICDGMTYAHAQKVLHLDLKPENIQVGLYGEVIICDWGLGKVIGDPNYDGGEFDRMLLNPDLLNNMTMAGEARGTPGFMAPEQVDGKRDVTFHSDIYALGALIYSILTGCSPIDLDNSLENILEQTSTGAIISPQLRFPQYNLPASLSAVAMKALQNQPQARYQTIEALRDDVYNFMSGYSTSAENASFLTEFQLFFKRQRSICLIIVLCMALLSALTVFFVNGLKNSMQKAEASQIKAEASRIKAEASRIKAKKNQQLAINEKERAEHLLTLYQEEKENLT